MGRIKRIGLYGGSFDPIHNGHLICSQQVMEGQKLDMVILIPNYISPFKKGATLTNPIDRYNMCLKAIKDVPKFYVSDMEIKQDKPCFTADTVHKFVTTAEGSAIYSLIVGDDAFVDFHKWWDPDKISRLCESIFVMTPTYSKVEIPKEHWNRFSNARSICVSHIGYHSKDLRELRARDRSLNFYTPKSVVKYIERNHLYVRTEDTL